MTNTERDAFEKCFKEQNCIPYTRTLGWDGSRYFRCQTQYAWEQWQAATAYARQQRNEELLNYATNLDNQIAKMVEVAKDGSMNADEAINQIITIGEGSIPTPPKELGAVK